MFKYLDNKQNGLLGEYILNNINSSSKISVITKVISVYSYYFLKKNIKNIEEIRILLTENPFEDKTNSNSLNIFGSELEKGLGNQLNLKYLSEEFAKWINNKANIKTVKNNIVLNKLINIENNEKKIAISTFSDFDSSGLGYVSSNIIGMSTVIENEESINQFYDFFDNFWKDTFNTIDIKSKVLTLLKYGYKDYSPKEIYFYTLYNIFKERVGELDENEIIKTKTGIKNTTIWNKLYNFQKDGVLGAIDKIEKYGGCIISDSVGLGKTFEALAVIKYYELRNDRVLILCPKKLRDNWVVYTLNDKRNILVNDRFNYDVLNHTDLSRDRGYSGNINLETINWSNYDLVVIDESHNFRNNEARRGIETRYRRLMNKIIKAGVKTKVLMLSATPVNNRMNDLKNQIAFITEGNDHAFINEGIESIADVMRQAQGQFNRWLEKKNRNKDINSLLEILDGRYFKLLELLTIARSRKHIEKYYDTSAIGKFPERLKPINIKTNIDLEGNFPPLAVINRSILKLNLSSYSPLKYVRLDKIKEYNEKYDYILESGSTFRQSDREESLIYLMRVNLLKRMESSIGSFSLTIYKILEQVNILLNKIENKSEYIDESLTINDIDTDDPVLEDFLIGNKIKVLLQDLDLIRFKQDLSEDKEKLEKLYNISNAVSEVNDCKLNKLKEIIEQKKLNNINEGNNKVIIFTAFADTAEYLYKNIEKWGKENLGLYSALVTGSGSNKTNLKGCSSDLTEILTNFAPIAKERYKIFGDNKDEIDILIATDCISEGQNLQDCDYLINYDIHWNPVRIIQRFGRIDRLGSKNEKIQLVNFWPNLELDEYINLEARVSGKMYLLDVSATGEENVIDAKSDMNDLDFRRKQLEQLQKSVIDLEDIQGGIFITDLTYNDFKMELMEYLKANKAEMEKIPNGVHSVTVSKSEDIEKGAIFCLKRSAKNTKNTLINNAIDPYTLVYVNNYGELKYSIAANKVVMDCLKSVCSPQNVILENEVLKLKNDTNNYKNMDFYTGLLEKGVEQLLGNNAERGTASLFNTGGTITNNDGLKSLEDFEIISFLVID